MIMGYCLHSTFLLGKIRRWLSRGGRGRQLMEILTAGKRRAATVI